MTTGSVFGYEEYGNSESEDGIVTIKDSPGRFGAKESGGWHKELGKTITSKPISREERYLNDYNFKS